MIIPSHLRQAHFARANSVNTTFTHTDTPSIRIPKRIAPTTRAPLKFFSILECTRAPALHTGLLIVLIFTKGPRTLALLPFNFKINSTIARKFRGAIEGGKKELPNVQSDAPRKHSRADKGTLASIGTAALYTGFGFQKRSFAFFARSLFARVICENYGSHSISPGAE